MSLTFQLLFPDTFQHILPVHKHKVCMPPLYHQPIILSFTSWNLPFQEAHIRTLEYMLCISSAFTLLTIDPLWRRIWSVSAVFTEDSRQEHFRVQAERTLVCALWPKAASKLGNVQEVDLLLTKWDTAWAALARAEAKYEFSKCQIRPNHKLGHRFCPGARALSYRTSSQRGPGLCMSCSVTKVQGRQDPLAVTCISLALSRWLNAYDWSFQKVRRRQKRPPFSVPPHRSGAVTGKLMQCAAEHIQCRE